MTKHPQSLEKTLAELAGLLHVESAELSAAQLLAEVKAWHEAGSPPSGVFAESIAEGATYRVPGDAQPRIEFLNGAIYLSGGTNAIGAGTPRLYGLDGGPSTLAAFLLPSTSLLIGAENTFSQSVVFSFDPSNDTLPFSVSVPDATPGHVTWIPVFVFAAGSHWDGAVSNALSAAVQVDVTHADLAVGFLEVSIGNGDWKFTEGGDIYWAGAAGGSLVLGTTPTSDPHVAGKVFSMDAAGLAAALGAGARYALISGG